MMIGDDHVDAALDRALHRLDAGDAAIDGYHQLHIAFDEYPLEHFDLQSVAVDQTMRNDERDISAE